MASISLPLHLAKPLEKAKIEFIIETGFIILKRTRKQRRIHKKI